MERRASLVRTRADFTITCQRKRIRRRVLNRSSYLAQPTDCLIHATCVHRSGQHTLRSFDRSALTWPQARVSTLERASHLVSRFFCAFSFRPCFQSPREFPCISSTPKFHLSDFVEPVKGELANGEFFEI